MIQDCASGNFSGTNDGLLDILSRSYPQSAPGTVTSLDSHGSKMVLTGHAGERSCGLKVWVPGDAKPSPAVTGITDMTITEVDGGWIIAGCAEGEYSLSTLGG